MKMTHVIAVGLLALSGQALAADARPCEAHYEQGGNFISGRTFTTWDVVPGVAPATAFSRIQVEGVKSGLRVGNSDKGAGILTFEQNASHKGQNVSLPWNVVIEAEGTGSKITVTKSTPPGYASSKEFQMASMCAVIDSARKK